MSFKTVAYTIWAKNVSVLRNNRLPEIICRFYSKHSVIHTQWHCYFKICSRFLFLFLLSLCFLSFLSFETGSQFVSQAILELLTLFLALASWVLSLQICTIIPSLINNLIVQVSPKLIMESRLASKSSCSHLPRARNSILGFLLPQ